MVRSSVPAQFQLTNVGSDVEILMRAQEKFPGGHH